MFGKTRWHFHTSAGGYANNFETPCGCYANANLDRYLLRFTGETKYGDNLERVLFNGMLAALPMQPDGRTFYYSDYHPGAQKQYFPARWPCCSGTYAEITADYPLDIYFHDDDSLFVNLFTPSEVRWQHGGQIITLVQTNEFSQADTIEFAVHLEKSAKFALKVRAPGWAVKSASVMVNGRAMKVEAKPGTSLKIARRWKDGDTVSVTFPKSLRFEPIDAQTPNLAALMYGPVLLVAMANGEVNLHGNQSSPDQWIKMTDQSSMTFRAVDGQEFRPLYMLNDEHYTTYCHIEQAN